MLLKLDGMYEEKEKLEIELEKIKEDIELLQTMIMYKYNREKCFQ